MYVVKANVVEHGVIPQEIRTQKYVLLSLINKLIGNNSITINKIQIMK